MNALALSAPFPAQTAPPLADFRAYLEKSLRDPFTINLRDCSLMEVIRICISNKSKLHPKYEASLKCLVFNLRELESQFRVQLRPIQVTDIFWAYFVGFCQDRGLKASTINTLCNQLRSILNWAVKYNAEVSPTYRDIAPPKGCAQKVALSAYEIARIAYFDIDRFYAGKRKDYRETMKRVRDMFVLSCNLFQRHSDMVRIDRSCFKRNIFSIIQQKTGQRAIVDIDRFSIDPATVYRILEEYDYQAPYTADIGNYNQHLHDLIRDVGIDDLVRIEERGQDGRLVARSVPKWQLVSSHTARRTAITINVLRGFNMHDLKRCSGHADLRIFDRYIQD